LAARDQLAAQRLHRRDGRVDLAQDGSDAVEQRLAGKRQLHAVGRAAQQLAAEHLLQRADLPAQRRLGDVEAFGRAAEVELLRHGDERAQVPQLDRLRRLREGEDVVVVGHGAIIDPGLFRGHADRA
jgi:hypothetical protein